MPGVGAAGSTAAAPSRFPIDFPVAPVGGANHATGTGRAEPLDAWYRAVDPHYFSAMGIPLREGRALNDSDSAAAAPVVVINQALARAAFPDRDALGQALVIGAGFLPHAGDLPGRLVRGIIGRHRRE